MRASLALATLLLTASGHAATPCEIAGSAIHWAYDACMARYETDDGLHPGVAACAERAQLLIARRGECKAKRIFKDRICALTEAGRASRQACMRDPSVVGSTVRNDGI